MNPAQEYAALSATASGLLCMNGLIWCKMTINYNPDGMYLKDWIRLYEELKEEGHLNQEGLQELERLKRRK